MGETFATYRDAKIKQAILSLAYVMRELDRGTISCEKCGISHPRNKLEYNEFQQLFEVIMILKQRVTDYQVAEVERVLGVQLEW